MSKIFDHFPKIFKTWVLLKIIKSKLKLRWNRKCAISYKSHDQPVNVEGGKGAIWSDKVWDMYGKSVRVWDPTHDWVKEHMYNLEALWWFGGEQRDTHLSSCLPSLFPLLLQFKSVAKIRQQKKLVIKIGSYIKSIRCRYKFMV